MATYTVKIAQNIFDVALKLYGSIEGIFDLLITNPELNMATDLQAGDVLAYHEGFVVNQSIVESFAADGITPANGERHVYAKQPDQELRLVVAIPEDEHIVGFSAMGTGTMVIDWGDNSELEIVTLNETAPTALKHWFDNKAEKRRLKIYGDFDLVRLDATDLKGVLFPTKPVIVDEYVCHDSEASIVGLGLFNGTYKVDLSGCTLLSLMPIADMSLSELDLTNAYFANPVILEEYLQYIAGSTTHGTRRACVVRLSQEPTEAGYQAINIILSEAEWNTPDQWQFYINGNLYQHIE